LLCILFVQIHTGQSPPPIPLYTPLLLRSSPGYYGDIFLYGFPLFVVRLVLCRILLLFRPRRSWSVRRHVSGVVYKARHAILYQILSPRSHTLSQISRPPLLKHVTHLGPPIFSSRPTYIRMSLQEGVLGHGGFVRGFCLEGFCPGWF